MSDKFGSAPIDFYENYVFIDEAKREEWENCPENVKKFVEKQLKYTCDRLNMQMTIDTLINVIQDLSLRIEILENKINDRIEEK
jgi:hypothetical protein